MEIINAISSTQLGIILVVLTYVSAIPSTDEGAFFPENIIEDEVTDILTKTDAEPSSVISTSSGGGSSGGGSSGGGSSGGGSSGGGSSGGGSSGGGSSGGGSSGGGSSGGGSSGGGSSGVSSFSGSSGGAGSSGAGSSGGGSSGGGSSPPPDKEENISVALIKIADPSLIQAGETVSYTYDVTNNGDANLNCGPIIDETLGDVSGGDIGQLFPGKSASFRSTENIFVDTNNFATVICTDDLGNPAGARTFAPVTIMRMVGGELLPIDTTSLLLIEAQYTTWLIPIVLSTIVGIGIFVVSRKSE